MSIGNLVEIVSYHLVETCQHMHTYIASRRDMCYHMYIHIEIKYVREHMIIMLGIDWGNSDEYIHTSTWAWEPHDVL